MGMHIISISSIWVAFLVYTLFTSSAHFNEKKHLGPMFNLSFKGKLSKFLVEEQREVENCMTSEVCREIMCKIITADIIMDSILMTSCYIPTKCQVLYLHYTNPSTSLILKIRKEFPLWLSGNEPD